MKKRDLVLFAAATAMVAGLMAGCTNKQATATAQTEAAAGTSNPDKEIGVSTEELREGLRDVPKQDGKVKLGVVAKSFDNEYWRTLGEGYGEYQAKAATVGYNITINVTSIQDENDKQRQLSIVKDMISKKYTGLLLSPISDGNLTPGVEDTRKAGIPIVSVNDDLVANADSFVGPKVDQSGELATEWITDRLGDKGKVAIVIGMPKAFATRQRTEGFENWMTANIKDIKIVAKQNADWDRQKFRDLADTRIRRYPDLNAILCNNDTMVLDVAEAIKSFGEDILVIGVDGIGEAYNSIRRGKLDTTIDSFLFHKTQIAGEVMLGRLSGREIPRVLWTSQAPIDSENVDKPTEGIIGWTDPVHAEQTKDGRGTIVSQRVRPLTDISKRGQNMVTMIHFSSIIKQFPGDKALDSMDLTVNKGEIHALLGENGMGKSTLLNILHDIYPDYSGSVEINGREVDFKNTNDVIESDIVKVHQGADLVTELTIGQNMALGYEVTREFFVDYDAMYKKTDVILERLGCKSGGRDRVTSLSTGEMQIILITKASFHSARIISFDESTSTLTGREVNRLFKMIMELKNQGATILYIIHRLDGVFVMTDRTSILHDGTYIITLNMRKASKEGLIRHMVGRDVFAYTVGNNPLCTTGEAVLEARDLYKNGVFERISFEPHRGEILSFAGLVGSKRMDVIRAIFGVDPYTSGEVYIKGERAGIKSPRNALQCSLGLIPENRKTQGFVKNFTSASNMTLAFMNRFYDRDFVDARRIHNNCMYYTGETNLHLADPDYLTESLNGGNAQKVIIVEWMTVDVNIIIFDEPTKGIDVGAKAKIYRLVEELVTEGKSIIMVSLELPEAIGISNRIVVMREDKITGVLSYDELNEEVIASFMMGG